jgi:class 3 adenylate cyclase
MYDDLANKHNIYKLETVGDCYVAVAGLMKPCENGMVELEEEYDPKSVHNIVAFAKDMIENVKKIRGPRGCPVAIRTGIHIGSVNSGVIGYKMPKFVLTGDAMNIASRLEQLCSPGAIHVSAEVINRLCPNTVGFAPRGAIEVKGKGKMNTFIYAKDNDMHNCIETELSSLDLAFI